MVSVQAFHEGSKYVHVTNACHLSHLFHLYKMNNQRPLMVINTLGLACFDALHVKIQCSFVM